MLGRMAVFQQMLQFDQRAVAEYFFARIIGERNGRTTYSLTTDQAAAIADIIHKRINLRKVDYFLEPYAA
jgi:hypothetical protein